MAIFKIEYLASLGIRYYLNGRELTAYGSLTPKTRVEYILGRAFEYGNNEVSDSEAQIIADYEDFKTVSRSLPYVKDEVRNDHFYAKEYSSIEFRTYTLDQPENNDTLVVIRKQSPEAETIPFKLISVSNTKRDFRTDEIISITRYLAIETEYAGLIDYHTNQEIQAIDWESRVDLGGLLPIENHLVEQFCQREHGKSYEAIAESAQTTKEMIENYEASKGEVDYSDAQA